MAQMEIYTTGGGTYLTDAFNFVAAFTSSGNFDALMVIGITLGVLFFSWRLMWGEGLREIAQWFVLVAVIGTVMVGARASVVIFDKTKSSLPIAIVDNVPYGVALIGHYTSTIGNSLTELFEAGLSTPNDVGYQNNGMFFGASLLAQTTRWRTTSTTLHSTMNNYVQNCVLDAALIGHVDFDTIANSGDLDAILAANAPNSLAFYNEFTDATVTCADGVAALLSEVDDYVDHLLISKANAQFSDNTTESSLQKVDRLTGSLDGFMSMLTTASIASRDQLAQSVLIQALDGAVLGYIADSGNAAAMDQYRAARAEAQTSASYEASFTQAIKWVPIMKIAFEFVYYAFFPIALILMLTPMAFTVMKGYFGGFVWLASWEPISAMLHAIVIRRSAGYYKEAGIVTNDDSSVAFVVNFANHLGIRSVEYDVSVLAGSMMTLVPFLALGIVFGANRFASMSTSMTNVSQGAAIETGKESATGTHSVSTVTANKWNTSELMDRGRSTNFLDDGASVTTNRDGSTGYATGSAASSFMTSASLAQSYRTASSQRLETAQSHAERAGSEQRSFIDQASNVYSEIMENSRKSTGFSDGGGNTYSTSDQQSVRQSTERIENFAKSHNLSTEAAVAATMAGGMSTPQLKALSARLEANGQLRGQSRESFESVVRAAESQNLSSDVSKLESFRRESGWQSSEEFGMGENEGQRHLLNEGKALSESVSRANETVERAAKSDEYVQSMALSGTTGLANIVQDYMQRQGYSQNEISQILNPNTAEDVQKGEGIKEGVLDYIGQSLGINTTLPTTPGLGDASQHTSPLIRTNGPSDSFMSSGAVDAFRTEHQPPSTVIRRPERGDAVETVNREGQARHSGTIERQGESLRTDAEKHSKNVEYEGGRTAAGALGRRVANTARGASTTIKNLLSNSDTTPAQSAGVRTLSQEEKAREKTWDVLNNSADSYPSLGRSQTFGGGSATTQDLQISDRDAMIRTIIGEASGEGEHGWAAVAHVIKNRVEDPRWASDVHGVVFQEKAFSAWNSGAGGNDLVNKYAPGDARYEQVGRIVDQVFAGQIADPTQGATHYYSPAGMNKLVSDGDQSNSTPTWLQQEQSRRPEADVRLGGHVFTGKKQG